MDIIIIIVQNGVVAFVISQSDLLVNMVAIENFRWNLSRLSIVTVVGVFASVMFMHFFQKRFKCGINTYFLFTCCLIWIWLLQILLVLATNFTVTDINLQTLIIFLVLLFDIVSSYSSPGWGLVLLYFVVPAHSRSFVSGMRHATEKFTCMSGYLIASFAYSHSAVLYLPLLDVCLLYTSPSPRDS